MILPDRLNERTKSKWIIMSELIIGLVRSRQGESCDPEKDCTEGPALWCSLFYYAYYAPPFEPYRTTLLSCTEITDRFFQQVTGVILPTECKNRQACPGDTRFGILPAAYFIT